VLANPDAGSQPRQPHRRRLRLKVSVMNVSPWRVFLTLRWSMQAPQRSSPQPQNDSLAQRHRDALARTSRALHARGIAINISDSAYVHDRCALEGRICLTPGPHALFGG
jgi:hypothetical protein